MLIFIPNLTLTKCIYERINEKEESIKGYNWVQSGWVSAVKYFVTDPVVAILTAAVMHSERLNESKLNRWVDAQSFGSILCILTVWLGRFLCSFRPFPHLFF